MPAVNLPDQQPQGNVTQQDPAPSGHLSLIINLSLAAVGLAVVFVLRLARQTRTTRPQGQALWSLSPAASSADSKVQLHQQGEHHFQQDRQRWASGVPTKSRGVSNNFAPVPSARSAEDFSQLMMDGESGQRIDGMDAAHDEDGLARSATIGIAVSRGIISRPPPPPPLTPPKLSGGVFPFEERRFSASVSTVGDLDASFFQQPNPDYMSSSSSSPSLDGEDSAGMTSALPHAHQPLPPTPRRRSYTKVLPLGPPQPVSTLELDGSITPFSPSSFPSSHPIFPLAPHDSFGPKEIGVQGEIISVMDESGAGWKRHTRVYGGGVCLACMASSEGGFYGDKVRPEERR